MTGLFRSLLYLTAILGLRRSGLISCGHHQLAAGAGPTTVRGPTARADPRRRRDH